MEELAHTPPARLMPNFVTGNHAHRHSLDSALLSLQARGVSPQRITLRRVGLQATPTGTIVRQAPAPGTPLTPGTPVELDVSGTGFVHALPTGMWDSGGEREAGTREILQVVDDPLEKLRHWFYEGAPLFRIGPDAPDACARWLSLFGIDAELWPRSAWYPLASVVAQIPQLSCSENGCCFLLEILLGLRVNSLSYRPSQSILPKESLSRLDYRASRLGMDLLLGDGAEDLAVLQVEVGPATLADYERFEETAEGRTLLRRVLDLILPVSTIFEVRWLVEDLRQAPRLGFAQHNARLGINTHMGMAFLPTHVRAEDASVAQETWPGASYA